MTVDEAVQKVIIDKLKQLIVDNDMVATRALLNSVRYEKNESFGLLSYDIIALDYIIGLDQGIEPGHIPEPTIPDLQKWIAAKNLELNPYAVKNSIKNVGTTWFRQGGSHIVTDTINLKAFAEIIELSKDDLQNKTKREWQLLFKNNLSNTST
jgi:hypothetical protein